MPNNVNQSGAALAQAAKKPRYVTVYSFKGGTDGSSPGGTMAILNGRFYGETLYGGGCNAQRTCGTIFTLEPSGIERVVYAFKGARHNDGAYPIGGLIAQGGALFGVTMAGGSNNGGTVFEITSTGSEEVLHQFTRDEKPGAAVTFFGGALYGTTFFGGGKCRCGSVFRLTLSGRKRVIYHFSNYDGANPSAPLIVFNGRLIGTTAYGGAHGLGVIFEVTPKAKFRVLHDFAGQPYDGNNPGGLLNYDGTLYGVTARGGAQDLGSFFAMKVRSKRPDNILHSFSGIPDGAVAQEPPIAFGDALWGVTFDGGNSECGATGCGTIYEFSDGGGERIIHAFPESRKDGYYPNGGLAPLDGALYGVTENGGTHGAGTIFKIVP
jgi:uncharacterized repeat protein (TIGR03803 family)